MSILSRTISRWRFPAVLAGLLTVMAANVASAHDGPGTGMRRSHDGAVAQQHVRYALRGFTAGQRAGFRAGYDAGRRGDRHAFRLSRHGRYGGRYSSQFSNAYARGYAEAYGRGYRSGSAERRRWRRSFQCW